MIHKTGSENHSDRDGPVPGYMVDCGDLVETETRFSAYHAEYEFFLSYGRIVFLQPDVTRIWANDHEIDLSSCIYKISRKGETTQLETWNLPVGPYNNRVPKFTGLREGCTSWYGIGHHEGIFRIGGPVGLGS